MSSIKKNNTWAGPSNSEQYLQNKSAIPQVSALMAQGVSQFRKDTLGNEVEQGLFRDGSNTVNKQNSSTINSNVVASVGFKKVGQVVSGGGGGFRGGTGDTVKQTPEVYSPLWLNSNLNLPRDRATINAWCRSFYALNPFVHNAINLHSTYPISKLNIKCSNKEIEKFFNEMIEEIDLMNICVQIAQEFWLLGESFVYAEYDESKGKWGRLLIQNPDYMVVKRTVIANEPVIMLRPDENLKKIVFSNKPSDIEQRKQLNQHIVDSVKRGDNIPIDNFHISHLARRISPYEIRGTGLPVSVFRQLMLFDKLRECYSEDTEVLTDKGFKKITDLLQFTSDININANFVNGIVLSQDNNIEVLSMKEDFKVACVNPESNTVEYHKPIEMHMSQYNGEMINFKSRNVDCLVTPNHKMWVQKHTRINGKSGWSNFTKVKAKDISSTSTYRFQGITNWNGKSIENVDVLGKKVPIELYLKFIGYVISEGYLGQNYIDFVQKIDSDCIADIKATVKQFAEIFNLPVYEREVVTKDYKKAGFNKQPSNRWNARINSKELMNYFIHQVGSEKSTSAYKKIPTWIKSLDKNSLSILLDTLVLGDGSHIKNKNSLAWKYYTISSKLADDVQEIAFKCGFAPSISKKILKSENTEYCVSWSDAADGNYPILTPNNKYPSKINKENYNGIVWCFEVPTGLFITRRNGKVAIQGNSKYAQADNMINPLTLVKIGSADFKPTFADLEAWRNIFEEAQYDKDFKVFTHEGVTVERVGYGGGLVDISNDITQIIKEIYVGLQVPSVLMDGGADTTYANGGVALDVLRQRYMQFRNMMAIWLKRKIFAPISQIQGFYDYSNGEKKLIVPDIDWNHMSLFDAGDYINTMLTLTQGEGEQKRASIHSLYRSLGLEFDDEIRKLRKEAIQSEISKKEKAALATMDLNTLRTLDDEDEITEPTQGPARGAGGPGEPPLPGEAPPSPPEGPGGPPPMPPI
jgi:hypothetical protein